MINEKQFKILIIANQPLSNTSSNGRTLLNMLDGIPANNLSQFYISGEKNDPKICSNYFMVSDSDVMSSIIKKKTGHQSINTDRRNSKNAFSKLAREVLWELKTWNYRGLLKFVADFSPDFILFQAGDSGFLCNITRKIALTFKIPVIIYNSEDYYFKNYDYLKSKGIYRLFYPFFHVSFKRKLRRLMKLSKLLIFNTQFLCSQFSFLNKNTAVIYTSSSISNGEAYKAIPNKMNVSYLGNLGVGRADMLVLFARELQKINPNIKLNVYGNINVQSIKEKILSCEAIDYHGFVEYERVKEVIMQSDLLVHVESFNEFYKKDLRSSFSTKIADCLASGRPFIMVAPSNLAATQYLLSNECAHVVTDLTTLQEKLNLIVKNDSYRAHYIDKAIKIANQNHNITKNSHIFKELLISIMESAEK